MPPLDKWSRDYGALLDRQAKELAVFKTLLRPEVYADLEQYCRSVNQPVTSEVMTVRESLKAYRAGGIHVCPIGSELNLILTDRQRFAEGVEYILRSNIAVVAQAKEAVVKQKVNYNNQIMKNIATKFIALAALFTELAIEFKNLKAGGGEGEGSDGPTLESLAELAGKKDPKLVKKVLGKFGAEIDDGTIKDLEESDFAAALEKLEALDDVEGAEEPKGKKGEIDLDAVVELAQELITDGKSDDIKKILKKFDAEKVTKLDPKHFAAAHAKFTALKD